MFYFMLPSCGHLMPHIQENISSKMVTGKNLTQTLNYSLHDSAITSGRKAKKSR